MSLALTVTPGVTFTSNSRVTASMLNALGIPIVLIPPGSITGDLLDEDSIVDMFGDVFRTVNWLPWGTIDSERFHPVQPVDCPVDRKTENPRGWFVQPTGPAINPLTPVTSQLSLRTQDNEALEDGRTGIRVNGTNDLTLVALGTWLPPTLTNQLQGASLTFSCYVWGGNLEAPGSPFLRISTPATEVVDEGNMDSRTGSYSDVPVVTGAWTRISFVVNPSAITNWSYGARLELEFTSTDIMDSDSRYVIMADAQIDKGVEVAAPFLATPPRLPEMPTGMVLPMARGVVPAGWLLCDGSNVTKESYARLYQAIGDSYSNPDDPPAADEFSLPDGRGRTFVGREYGAVERLEMSMTPTVAGTVAQFTLAVVSTAGLRLGMGAFGTGIGTNAEISGLTETQVTLSVAHSASVPGPVRFGKLGPGADPEVLGSAGDGMSYGRNEVKFTKMGCTVSGTTLTVPMVDDLACGMTVSGLGIPATAVIEAFLTGTSSTVHTLRISQSHTNATPGIVTFGVDAPEGNEMERYQYLRQQVVMRCAFGNGTDSTPDATYNRLLKTGMSVTGTGLAANTYVTLLSSANYENFTISPAPLTAASTVELTFNGGTLTRTAEPTPDMLPAFVGNWIIKT